jgi:outer membrane lipoprotein-sorting protein
MIKPTFLMFFLLCFSAHSVHAQDVEVLLNAVKKKLDKVNSYEAEGTMKTNVSFLKIPVSSIKMYFKKPSKVKIKTTSGLSFLPKGAVQFNLNSILSDGDYMVIDGGAATLKSSSIRIVKLLPKNESSPIVLTTLYILPEQNIILKSITTTKENGTYELNMTYQKYKEWGLPDQIIFAFNTKDYKLPKGITFDFDDGAAKKKSKPALGSKKAEVLINIKNYVINKPIAEEIFK